MAATLDSIIDALLDNADFEETGSVTKAKAFATAAVRYLIAVPKSQGEDASQITIDHSEIRRLLDRARAYINANNASSTAGRTRFLSAAYGFRR